MTQPGDSYSHGTHASYANHGCRCDACRAGHNRQSRESGWNVRAGPRAESKQRWDRENKLICACGAPRSRGHSQCLDCRHREMREGRELRRALIQELWEAGTSTREIAAAMGSTRNSIQTEITYMRRDGWDLPYRMVDGVRVG